MPSMEERMIAVERALRMHSRDRATQRGMVELALQDIHDRFDRVEAKIDADNAELRQETNELRQEMNQRFDAIQSDLGALITAVGKLIKP